MVQTDDVSRRGWSARSSSATSTFAYTTERPVLENFSLTIAPGETIAFVGHTGAGKSTLGRLIARFYEFQGGEILIDGHDIRSFDLSAYRRQLGIVPQIAIPLLRHGRRQHPLRRVRMRPTSRSRRRPHIGQRRLGRRAAGRARDRGRRGGARHCRWASGSWSRWLACCSRIRRIVILDEATASVDPLTEAQIQEGLDVGPGRSDLDRHRAPA